jgi:hypothetical protein
MRLGDNLSKRHERARESGETAFDDDSQKIENAAGGGSRRFWW